MLLVESASKRYMSDKWSLKGVITWRRRTAAILVSQTNPVGVELFTYVNNFFCSNKSTRLLVTWVKTPWSPHYYCTSKKASFYPLPVATKSSTITRSTHCVFYIPLYVTGRERRSHSLKWWDPDRRTYRRHCGLIRRLKQERQHQSYKREQNA